MIPSILNYIAFDIRSYMFAGYGHTTVLYQVHLYSPYVIRFSWGVGGGIDPVCFRLPGTSKPLKLNDYHIILQREL